MRVRNRDTLHDCHQVTFDIDIDPNGPSEADFEAVAERYARNRAHHDERDSKLRRLLSFFGLRLYHPETRRIRA